jgi:hypothetical protein
MEIKDKYLNRYFHDIAMEQLYDEYTQMGYIVHKNHRIGSYEADIIAEKDNEKIVIEIKSGRMTPDKKQRLADLANYVRSQGDYKFMVVVPTPPQKKQLEVENIEQLLLTDIIHNLPNELDQLSTHTSPDEVYEVDIDEIKIDEDSIFIKGDGTISVNLDYGSDSDDLIADGYAASDSFPFSFTAKLTYDERTKKFEIEDADINVDTSSFYE